MLAKEHPSHPNFRWMWFWKDTGLTGLITPAECSGDKFKKKQYLNIIAFN